MVTPDNLNENEFFSIANSKSTKYWNSSIDQTNALTSWFEGELDEAERSIRASQFSLVIFLITSKIYLNTRAQWGSEYPNLVLEGPNFISNGFQDATEKVIEWHLKSYNLNADIQTWNIYFNILNLMPKVQIQILLITALIMPTNNYDL